MKFNNERFLNCLTIILLSLINSSFNKSISTKLRNNSASLSTNFLKENKNTETEEKIKPMNGCINFYNQCNFKGDIIIELCHWRNTGERKLITRSSEPNIKYIKSIAFSEQTTLYIDYVVNRLPKEKFTISKDVPCIDELFKTVDNFEITILEAFYEGI